MNRFKSVGKRGDLSRTNTTSSIRGKISAPIPMEDDEFPMRAPTPAMATPLHEDSDKQLQLSSQSTTPERDTTPTHIAEPIKVSPRTPAVHPIEAPVRQSNSHVSRFRESDLSMAMPVTTEIPQRKKSTLKSVLGRLFGGKKKKAGMPHSSYGHANVSPRAGQHLSDPPPVTPRSPTDRVSPHERAKSVPINAFNRALRSHSVTTNIPPQFENDNQNEVRMDQEHKPNYPVTANNIYTGTKSFELPRWNGLTPRPSTGVARSATAEESRIGYALTSGSHPHRRSRSVGHLRSLSPTALGPVRRRSDDIKFWRDSYDPEAFSPISSQQLPEGELDTNEEPSPQNVEAAESGVYDAPQPFNFGTLGETEGMKITQAVSLDSRVSKLEDRIQMLENLITQLHNHWERTSGSFHRSPRGRSVPDYNWSRRRLTTESSDPSLPTTPRRMYPQQHNLQAGTGLGLSTDSIRKSSHQLCEDVSPLPTLLPSPEPAQSEQFDSSGLALPPSNSKSRPLSTSTTIRGVSSTSPTNSNMPLSKNGSLTAHHYSALLNLIEAERRSREKLEDQLQTLQHQLNLVLSALPYPTSSRDYDEKTTPRVSSPRGEFSTFDHGESDTDSEDGAIYERYDDFSSPIGESEDETENGEDQGKHRTLSLSQMTLGRGPMQAVNY